MRIAVFVLVLGGSVAWVAGGAVALVARFETIGLPDVLSGLVVSVCTLGLVVGALSWLQVSGRLLRAAVLAAGGLALAAIAWRALHTSPLAVLAALGAYGAGMVAHLVFLSRILRQYRCAACGRERMILVRGPQPCPGTERTRHAVDEGTLVCPTCASRGRVCRSCASLAGCTICGRDLSGQPHCPGPLDAPSQCVGQSGARYGVRLCPTHYPERCPACDALREKLARGRAVADAPRCALCGGGPDEVPASMGASLAAFGTPGGPLYHCYDHPASGAMPTRPCTVIAHEACFQSDNHRLCYHEDCEMHRYHAPRPGQYYPGGTLIRRSLR